MPFVVSITEIPAQQAPADGIIAGPQETLVVSVTEIVASAPIAPAVIEIPAIPVTPAVEIEIPRLPTQADGFLLLVDGVSYLLLTDGVSRLILTQGWTGQIVSAQVSVTEIGI